MAHGAVAADSSANILQENGGVIRAATDSRLPDGRSCSQSSRLGFSEPAPSDAHEQLRESYTVAQATGVRATMRGAPAGAEDMRRLRVFHRPCRGEILGCPFPVACATG